MIGDRGARCAAIAVAAALLAATGAMNATAAELSADQVTAMLKSASASVPADFTGKDLSDFDKVVR